MLINGQIQFSNSEQSTFALSTIFLPGNFYSYAMIRTTFVQSRFRLNNVEGRVQQYKHGNQAEKTKFFLPGVLSGGKRLYFAENIKNEIS